MFTCKALWEESDGGGGGGWFAAVTVLVIVMVFDSGDETRVGVLLPVLQWPVLSACVSSLVPVSIGIVAVIVSTEIPFVDLLFFVDFAC